VTQAKKPRKSPRAGDGIEPEIVDTPQGRMVRAPAGQLIPETQFLAMTTLPVPPSDEQLEAERQRLGWGKPIPREVMRTLARDIVDFHFNPDHPLRQPTFDEKVIAAGPDGDSRRHKAETLAVEQIAAAMRAGATRPSALPQVPRALSPVHVVVAVEIGSDWIDQARVLYPRAGRRCRERFAASKVLYSISVFHPERAEELKGHIDDVINAIRAWRRRAGRPVKGEYKGSKWDAIAKLCKIVHVPAAARDDRAAATIKKAWERSETK
jgi:hypothetical protein